VIGPVGARRTIALLVIGDAVLGGVFVGVLLRPNDERTPPPRTVTSTTAPQTVAVPGRTPELEVARSDPEPATTSPAPGTTTTAGPTTASSTAPTTAPRAEPQVAEVTTTAPATTSSTTVAPSTTTPPPSEDEG
jgi:hypothetical protein